MNAFWLISALMVLAAIAAVLIPVLRYRPRDLALTHTNINTRLFHERMTELATERADGRIDEAQYQQLKLDLERTLLLDIPATDIPATDIPAQLESNTSYTSGKWGIGLVAGLLLPVLAFVYYYFSAFQGELAAWMQTREQMNTVVQMAVANPAQLPPEALQNLPDFTRVLQARVLRDGMHDPDQLMLLGISLLELGAAAEARSIMLQALELAPERTDVMMGTAQTLLMTNEGRLDPTSAKLLHAVLKKDPSHQGALMMLGFGAFNGADYAMAQQAWQLLLSQLPAESESSQLLKNSIAQAEKLSQQTADQAATNQTATPAASAQVAVTVDIAPRLQNRFQADDTLFIFAKAANGPPMPLAAIRQPASGFPIQVVLDDSNAMMPSMKLSNFQQIIVGARISKGGDVSAQPGDLEALSEPLDLANSPLSIQLVVDQVVQ